MRSLITLACLAFSSLSFASDAAKDAGAGKPGAANQSRPLEVADVARLVRVSDPKIAPDGRSIVIVVSRVNLEKNRHDTELVLVDIASGAQRILTHEREGVGQPHWSPGGDRLAFLAKVGTGKDAKLQVFIMPMNGGDPRRVTDAPGGVQHFAWKPDGKEIAYAAPDEPANKKAAEKGEDAFEVGDDSYLITAAPLPVHIWLVSAEGGKARRLTSGTWTLPVTPPPGSPSSPLSWSPDGRSIALVRQDKPHFGDADERSVQILTVADGKIKPLTGYNKFEGFPTYSPDGSLVSYWHPRDGDPVNQNEIYLAGANGSSGSSLTRDLDRCVYQSLWMPDGKSLLVGGNDGTRVSLWLQPVRGTAKRLELGSIHPSWSFWIDATLGKKGEIAFTGSEPGRPAELYYMPSADAPPKRLTDFNAETARRQLGRVETITWEGPDGFHEDGIIIYPPGFEAGKKYPLVLEIHGGPRAASTESFALRGQLIASHGYVVFMPNYRGSDNLGNAYQRAIFKDSGAGPGRDVMAGIEALKRRGFIDPERMAVTGWSYGGYMTSWLIGHYPGWKAAVAGAAVTDLLDQYNLSDGNVARRYVMGGSPWVGGLGELFRQQSPITYAPNIRTPTLILCDTGDARVPITNSYRLYHALRDNNVPVKFIAYPVPGHFPSDPARAMDVYRRWIGWLDEHLRDEKAARAR
jgi:dipeptidyl aminopeptidase/acylaminoacyl peptidase